MPLGAVQNPSLVVGAAPLGAVQYPSLGLLVLGALGSVVAGDCIVGVVCVVVLGCSEGF